MSAARALAILLGGERRLARWRLRGHAPLDEARESEPVFAVGVVRPLDETLVAPLSGRVCVAYRSRVRLGIGAGIQPVRETMQVRPFVLDLGDEEVIVEGDAAIFGLAPVRRVPPDIDRERSFLARHALLDLDRGWSTRRFSEVALEPGARVAVGGTLVLVPRDEPLTEGELGFRDPPPPSQRILGNRERPLLFVGLDGPGGAA